MAVDYSLRNAKCKIGSWDFCPQELTLTIADVDYESGRSASGKMQRNMLGTCYTYKVSLPPCDTDTVRKCLRALAGEYQECTFYDPIKGANRTARYYVGDREVKPYSFKLDLWESVEFTMIEKDPRNVKEVLA